MPPENCRSEIPRTENTELAQQGSITLPCPITQWTIFVKTKLTLNSRFRLGTINTESHSFEEKFTHLFLF